MKPGELIVWAAPRQPNPDWGCEDDVVVWVCVLAMDAAWKLDCNYYIEPGGKGAAIADRYQGVGMWLRENTRPIALPEVCFQDGVVSFADGRHRFAWFRDQGLPALPVQVASERADEFERLFGTTLRSAVMPDTLDTLAPSATAPVSICRKVNL